MRRADPWASEPQASGVRTLSLRPHAVYHPARREAALGFKAVVFFRKALEAEPVSLRTRRFDTVVPCASQCEAHFQAALLALRSVEHLPEALRVAPLRIHVQDSHLGRVLAKLEWPGASEHVPDEVLGCRKALLAFFEQHPRRPYVDGLFTDRDGNRSALWRKRFGSLERRLLEKAWGLKRRPQASGMTLDVRVLGKRLRSQRWDSRVSPPMLGLLVDTLKDAGNSFDEIADALALDKRRLYEAKARWKQAAESTGAPASPG